VKQVWATMAAAGVLAAAGCGETAPPPPPKHEAKYDQPQTPPPKGQKPTME
jgi:hypothetical protein